MKSEVVPRVNQTVLRGPLTPPPMSLAEPSLWAPRVHTWLPLPASEPLAQTLAHRGPERQVSRGRVGTVGASRSYGVTLAGMV